MSKSTRQIAIERSAVWWLCENLVNHDGQIALLKMDFPRVFILMRDYGASYFSTFEQWRDAIIEVNFLDPTDRDTADLDTILIDAWNFLALQEEKEDELAEE